MAHPSKSPAFQAASRRLKKIEERKIKQTNLLNRMQNLRPVSLEETYISSLQLEGMLTSTAKNFQPSRFPYKIPSIWIVFRTGQNRKSMLFAKTNLSPTSIGEGMRVVLALHCGIILKPVKRTLPDNLKPWTWMSGFACVLFLSASAKLCVVGSLFCTVLEVQKSQI